MIFIIGPVFNGKKAFAKNTLGFEDGDIFENVQNSVSVGMSDEDLKLLADSLAKKKVVIATETGGGIVPADFEQRQKRELEGRLNCLLAQKAETVVRVFCGLPVVLKGKL